ncbi:MAG: hypothetical protein OJF50_002750 [Nitrospira sp.]|jgi:tetratricopeptide (TPR) repeat protein|nr:hypothetical protein [Nitrospira sp.]
MIGSVGPQSNGITPYLGIVKHGEPYFGLDAEVHPLEFYAKYYKHWNPREYYAEKHACHFAVLLKGDGFLGYSELGVASSHQQNWQNLQSFIPAGTGKVERIENVVHLKGIWNDSQAHAYTWLFTNQEFRKLLTYLEGQPFWAVGLEEDPLRSVVTHYERGLAHLKTKAFNNALTEFEKGLRLMPGSALGHLLRGHAYVSLGQHDRGASDFATALALDREISKSKLAFLARQGLLTRGVTQEQAGKGDDAFISYWEATKFLPDDGMAELALIQLSARTHAGRGNSRVHMACDHLKAMKEEYSSCHDFIGKAWFPNRDWTEPRSPTSDIIAAIVATGLVAVGIVAISSSTGNGGVGSAELPLVSSPSMSKKHWLDIAKCLDSSPGALAPRCF